MALGSISAWLKAQGFRAQGQRGRKGRGGVEVVRVGSWAHWFEQLEERLLLTVYGPLITFPTWNQSGPIGVSTTHYNDYVPIDPATNGRSEVGCSLTAAAQVAYYWHYPQNMSFSSSNAYTSMAGTASQVQIDADSAKYDFPNFSALNAALANIKYNGDPQEEALLGFALGIKSRADYSLTGTPAFFLANAFGALGFESGIDSFDWAGTKPAVIANIENGQPVLAQVVNNSETISHMVILDGYDTSNDTFHANFGWGGFSDGWITGTNFGTFYFFNHILEVTYNIAPKLAVPNGLQASFGTYSDHVHLTWNASPGAKKYEVWRSASNDPSTAIRLSTPIWPADASYDDMTDTAPGQPYYYWVRAISDAGHSAFSAVGIGTEGAAVAVAIPDGNLLAAIRQTLAIATRPVTDRDLRGMTRLDAAGRGISDLTGLQYATHLYSLSLANNNISDISALAPLTDLQSLDLSGNHLNNISPLGTPRFLMYLYLQDNSIHDITPVAALAFLWGLDLDNNPISDISALSSLKFLRNFSLDQAQANGPSRVADISALAGMQDLNALSLSNQNIGSIAALAGLHNLQSLILDHNHISDLSALSGCSKLSSLDLSGNGITDMAALAGLTGLTTLSLNDNQIANLAALAALVNLTELNLMGNVISDISSLQQLKALVVLRLSSNQISDISALPGLTKLSYIWLDNNFLDLETGSATMATIATLRAHPATVVYSPQRVPNTPSVVAPAYGVGGVSLTVTLAGGTYVDPLGVGQTAAHWVVTRVADGVVVFDSGTDASNLGSCKIPQGILAKGTVYSWRVRYQSTDGRWSLYSYATPFTTVADLKSTTVTITLLNSPAMYGQTPQFRAQVTGAGGTPTGSVQFQCDGVNVWNPVSMFNGIAGNFVDQLGAGDHAITAIYSGDLVYSSSSATVTQSVVKAALYVRDFTALDKQYDGTRTASLVFGSAAPEGLVSWDSGKVTLVTSGAVGTFSDKNVGTGIAVAASGLALSGSSAANYTLLALDTHANITARTLAIGGITAGDKVYDGTTIVSLTGSPTLPGVVTGESVVLGGSISGRFVDRNVGSHKTVLISGLSISGTSAANYTLGQPTLTGSISARPITVTVNAQTRTYGQAIPTLSYQITSGSLASGESLSGSLTRAPGVHAGSYVIGQGSLSAGPNYNLLYVGANLTIGRAPLTITADSKTKAYGLALPALTASCSGLVNGDTWASLTTQPTLTTSATAESSIAGGPYTITVSGAVDSDYVISYVPGTLTVIDSAPPTAVLIAHDPSGVGATAYQFQVKFTDDMAVLGTSLALPGAVRVTGPGVFGQVAEYVSTDQAGDGATRTATYQIVVNHGATWSAAEEGVYSVILEGNVVSDTSGNKAAGGTIGHFFYSYNPLFSERYYLTQYPDIYNAIVAGTFTSGYQHYLMYGQAEGRNPSSFFDESFYRKQYPAVDAAVKAGAFKSGFDHFVKYGAAGVYQPSLLFNQDYYLRKYAGVAAAIAAGTFSSALQHFMISGQYEGYDPSIYFDTAYYLSHNTDVAAAIGNGQIVSAFSHFLDYGMAERRSPLAVFDEGYYLSHNADVAAAVGTHVFLSGYAHYVTNGQYEVTRVPSTLFDSQYYLSAYPDVAAAVNVDHSFPSAFFHYLWAGKAEGRSGCA